MRTILFLISLFTTLFVVHSQELNCKVTVVANQVTGSNKQIFKTMENSISDLMNKTKWTDRNFKKQEKIQCVLTINISEQVSSDQFKGNMQLQVVRPVYNSTYLSPILNYNDNDINFTYEEFEPLILNETSFESNLVSLIAFYSYVILGVDADTFELNGGDKYFRKAEKTMLLAQQGGARGWNSTDGQYTRFKLIDNMLNSNYEEYRITMYNYHLSGLDTMFKDKAKAKVVISSAVTDIKKIYSRRPSAYLLRVFLDTKADEIISIFKDGPKMDTRQLREMLIKVYPAKNESWSEIK